MTAINKVFSIEAFLINAHSDSGEDDLFLLKTGVIKSPWQEDTASQAAQGNNDHPGLLTERAERNLWLAKAPPTSTKPRFHC